MSPICRLPWIAASFIPGSMRIGLRGSPRNRWPSDGTRSQSKCWSGTGRTRTTTRRVASSRRTSRSGGCVFGRRGQRPWSFSYRPRRIRRASFRFSQGLQLKDAKARIARAHCSLGAVMRKTSDRPSGAVLGAEGEDATRQRRDGHPGREHRPVTGVDREAGPASRRRARPLARVIRRSRGDADDARPPQVLTSL